MDLLVIGGGSGGVRCARIAASLGANVTLVEEKEMGGTCVNLGCVPKKLLVMGSHASAQLEDARGFGWDTQAAPLDWSRLIANKDDEIRRLNGIYDGLLERAGVTIVRGRATVLDANTVSVNGEPLQAKHLLIATGSRPQDPPIVGIEHAISSDQAFHLDRRPDRVVMLGGGYIATEFAGIFHGFGAQVTQLYRGELFLRGFDADCRRVLAEEMRGAGVDLRFETNATAITQQGDGYTVTLTDGSALPCDLVMAATGRLPNTQGLGLADAGVTLSERGAVVVDERFQTSVPSIHALGDVIDTPQLTPVALAQGTRLAHHLFGDGSQSMRYDLIPTAIFSTPALSTVGLTEEAARAQHDNLHIYESRFTPMHHHLTGRKTKSYMKLVVDAATDRVLGCHMVGEHAPEIIQGLAVALECGATKAQFDATLGIHPTAAEEFVTMRSARDL